MGALEKMSSSEDAKEKAKAAFEKAKKAKRKASENSLEGIQCLWSAKEKAKNESENRAKWKCIALYQVKIFAEKSNDLSQFITEEAKNISHGSHVTPKIVGWFNENRRGFSSNKV